VEASRRFTDLRIVGLGSGRRVVEQAVIALAEKRRKKVEGTWEDLVQRTMEDIMRRDELLWDT